MKMTFPYSCALLSCRRLFSCFPTRTRSPCISTASIHMDIRDEAKPTKPTMEIVNVPPVVSTYRQALRTFDDKNKKDFTANLNKLKALMDKLKAEDFGFDKSLSSPDTWRKPNKAPCTYIEVFQNNRVNMSIFVLKPGFKMPLHDHPLMHGLLKVISGAVKIRSFSEYPAKTAVDLKEFARKAKEEAARLAKGTHKRRKLFAEISNNRICSHCSDTCVLTPTISNYHEIEALEMPAAFFDILSPPYDAVIEDIGPRRCGYYNVVSEISTNLVEMQEIDAPECFYCDQAPYLGPMLT